MDQRTKSFENRRPLRIINSIAPIRICDNGGWTDTWFAEHGKVFNIGVYPYAEVQIEVYRHDAQEERVIIYAENYGERYVRHLKTEWDRHPLLEAAIEYMGVPDDVAFQVTIYSEAPAGASTGTSATSSSRWASFEMSTAISLLTSRRIARARPARSAWSSWPRCSNPNIPCILSPPFCGIVLGLAAQPLIKRAPGPKPRSPWRD